MRLFAQIALLPILGLLVFSGSVLGEAESPDKKALLKTGQVLQLTTGYTEGRFPQLDGLYFISERNTVRLPEFGRLSTKGKTLVELRESIRGTFVRKTGLPRTLLSLNVCNTPGSREVVVMGQVGKPGKYAVTKGMTFEKLLQLAGGVTDFGASRRTQLLRDGKRYVYDMASQEGQRGALVKSGDILLVPLKQMVGR